ncbi:MAG: tetratricopeptide repeat protein [Bacteroidales bacterium]|nr:tetratricopeptide repeat protein [Bacteroidales bacterium]
MMYRRLIILMLLIVAVPAFGQTDRKEVRHGNREFKKDVFQTAEIDYKKALLKDSLSNAANFNLGNTYYRMENYSEADRYYSAVSDSLDRAGHGAESYFNQGDSFLKQRNWQAAVEAFKNSLRRNPDDMDAKSNLAYAQKMLQNEQQGGGGQNQDQNKQNQDQNQDQQNQDQNNDQNQDNQDQQNQNQDQNKDNNDQNQDQQDQQNQQGQGGEQPKISPQAAQQMLQAIQEQEKQTQDKVNKEKALKAKSKQKDKNW